MRGRGLGEMWNTGFRRRNVLMAAGSVLLNTACNHTLAQNIASGASEKDTVMLEDFALSPDGRIVAFQFTHPHGGQQGLGLFEWQTGKLTRIPNPVGKQLGKQVGGSSFSHDGKKLAVVISDSNERVISDIAVIDLVTMATTQITHGDRSLYRSKVFPVFQPGTSSVLYVEEGIGIRNHLKLVDIVSGKEEIILQEKDGFYEAIFRPSFVGANQIYFQAIAPADEALQRTIVAFGASSGATAILYRLNFGDKPQILFPDLEKARNSGQAPIISYFSASGDGEVMTGIAGIVGGNQLFRIDKNRLIQLTNFNGYPARACESYDGSTVAFGLDPMLGKNFELIIFKLNDSQIIKTDLLNKIRSDQDFL